MNSGKDASADKKEEDGVSFLVSTNAIVTSSFSKLIRSRLTMMAINFRGRVKSLAHKDAGNYEAALYFDSDVYHSPTSIREAITTTTMTQLQQQPINPSHHPAHTKALQGLWESTTSTFGQITNWSACVDANAGKVAGILPEDAEQILHLPLYK